MTEPLVLVDSCEAKLADLFFCLIEPLPYASSTAESGGDGGSCPLTVDIEGAMEAESLASLAMRCSHTRSTRMTSVCPLISASASGVIPFLSALLGFAPHVRRIWTISAWPLAAAKWSGVEPGMSIPARLAYIGRGGDETGRLTSGTDAWRCALFAVRVPPWQSWGVHICSTLDQHAHHADTSSGASGMKRQDAVEDRIDWLAMCERVMH